MDKMELYLAESRPDREGYREQCIVRAGGPSEAAKLADDIMQARVAYVWAMLGTEGEPRAVRLLDVPQWRIERYGQEYHAL